MASSSLKQLYCSLCAEDHENELATVWCPQCHDALCAICSKHHRRSKNSKHHMVVSVEDYEKLPQFLKSQPDLCPEHDIPFDLYCKKHETSCCVNCVPESHADCCSSGEIASLVDIVKHVKSSAKLETIETWLRYVIQDFNSLDNYLTSNLNSVDSQVGDCMSNYKAMRLTIEKHLDSIESDLQKRLQREKTTIKLHVESLRDDLRLQKDSAEKMSQDLTMMKDIATEHQVFFALPGLANTLTTLKEYIYSLTKGNKLLKRKLSLTLSELKNVKTQLSSLMCDLSAIDNPCDVILNVPRKEKVQLMAPVMSTTNLQEIVLKPKRKVDLKRPAGGNIEGCAISLKGEIYFVCSKTRTLYMYETNAKIVRRITRLYQEPLGVAVSSDGTHVYVSSNTDVVFSIGIADERYLTMISMNCYDIEYFNGNIFGSSFTSRQVLWGNPASETFNKIRADFDLYCITANDDAIACTHFDDNKVVCFDYKGEPKWQYRDDKLKSPIGITSTSSGIVFVSGRSSDNVHMISADGKEHRIILSKTDGMDCPRAINFSDERKELVVINEYTAEMFLFDVVI